MSDQIPTPDQINAMFDAIEAHRHDDEPEPAPHYHVVAFIDGCLNDYDSGPINDYTDALADLDWYMETTYPDTPTVAGQERYQVGPYIIKVEECREACDPEGAY